MTILTTSTLNEANYKGLPIYTRRGLVNINILESIENVLSNALAEHARTLLIRFDLRFPDKNNNTRYQSNVISKFTDSLKAKVKYDIESKKKAGIRVHPCTVRFLWVKEIKSSTRPHYHVAILINGDKYLSVGKFKSKVDNMATRIQSAWSGAIGVHPDTGGIVYFPDNGTYKLYRNEPNFHEVYKESFYRLSYFAKYDTKAYNCKLRTFGCSRL